LIFFSLSVATLGFSTFNLTKIPITTECDVKSFFFARARERKKKLLVIISHLTSKAAEHARMENVKGEKDPWESEWKSP
jgi:hypothetical protein